MAENGASASQPVENPVPDPELDDLLDSALSDFDKAKTKDAGKAAEGQAAGADGGKPAGVGAGEPQSGGESFPTDEEALFSEVFEQELAGQIADEFEKAMKTLEEENPQLMAQFSKLAEAAAKASDIEQGPEASPEGGTTELASSLSQTLQSMAQNAEELQNNPLTEDDLLKAMSDLGLGSEGTAEGAGATDLLPMMQTMMKNLLSKEVLYPSLKDICQKYPDWLEQNKSKLSQEDNQKYSQQFELMKQICGEFESEAETDAEEVKAKRFEKTLDLMQKMQDLGQPPKELVGEMAPGIEFDEHGVPKLPGGKEGEACSVM
ncbi:peroxisomal biogenesis factor 19-like [Branchiostoma floridae]|uniref:Peroxisomal biogenesis factor 19 n=1 Tax=Branchiostoma floridae TaxID=7739 RepID=A0A9J7L7K2_BRAFL|nr:peroxisomal biogenesis factor 19-like [Branchiostoma floridae]